MDSLERYRYYRTRRSYANPSYGSELDNRRKLYHREVYDKEPREKVRSPSYKNNSQLREDVKSAKIKVEDLLEELRAYKRDCEELATDNNYKRKNQEPQRFVNESQVREFLNQCKSLGRQIDSLENQYNKIKSVTNKQPANISSLMQKGSYQQSYKKAYETQFVKPSDIKDIHVKQYTSPQKKDYDWKPLTTHLNTTRSSLLTNYESPARMKDYNLEKLTKERDELKNDCNNLRTYINTLERKDANKSMTNIKRIEDLEKHIGNLANVLDKWSSKTSTY